jgi:prepilin-type N-terminal cleavage/methylation domain-containing protein
MVLREDLDMKKSGFTLLEVLVVVIIIGILSALAWSSMGDLIQTNKTKEASKLMTAFVEKALTESKMRKKEVTISIPAAGNKIIADMTGENQTSEIFSNNFTENKLNLPTGCGNVGNINKTTTSEIRIGTSGIVGPVCFVVCNAAGTAGYCAGTVKTPDKNTFTAYIKKKNSTWEAL